MRKLTITLLLLALIAAAFGVGFPTRAQSTSGCPEGLFEMMTPELESACKGELAGKEVTMNGPFTGPDEVIFNESIKEFEAWTGIDIKYTGSKEFEAAIAPLIESGAVGDIVDFPQPGLLGRFAKAGQVIDLTGILNQDWIKKNYNQSWIDMSMVAGKEGTIMGGIWARFNGKSLVWYPKKAFEAAGYTIPTTWDELIALSQQIVADGAAPWCIGIESGAATGWAATDWIEDIMLRTTSLENYDNWATPKDPANRLKFTDPAVKAAAEKMAEVWLAEGFVFGGRQAIAGTYFGDSPKPMFDNPPGCYMHRQGNFITSFFPKEVKAGEDYSFFYLPPIDPAYGKPFLVAGDIYAMFKDRPEVRAVMDFFSRGESLKGWLAAGGALSPHMDAKLEWYGSDIERGIAALVAEATSFRFDGSDLMPGAVGSGSFWKGMTDWISGTIDLDKALEEIDAAWPQ